MRVRRYAGLTVLITLTLALPTLKMVAGSLPAAPKRLEPQNTPEAQKAPPGLANADFEQGAVGQTPPGWFVPPAVSAAGFSAALTNDRPKSGRQCVLLQGGPNVEINENSFGNIMQTLDATPYRGKRIHLHAVIRLQAAAPNDQARVWLRVDRANGAMGLFNNMSDHPLIVSDKAWHECDIVGNVEADAERLSLGLLLIGKGKAWMDNVSLTIEGDANEANGKAANGMGGKAGAKMAEAMPIPSPATIERLAGLCRVWGAAKYFHPWLAYKNIDWDGALIAAIPKVRAATSAGEYKAAIDGMLAALRDPATHTLPLPGTNMEATNGNGVKSTPPAGKDGGKSQPYVRWLDPKTALIVADDWTQFVGNGRRSRQFIEVFQEASRASAIIFDLRNTSSNLETAYWLRSAFEQGLPALLTTDLPLTTSRHRMYSGYPPQVGGTSGGYYTAWVTPQASVMRAVKTLPAPPRMAFLVNANTTGISDICSGLQAAKLATIVQEGEAQAESDADTYAMTLPDNVTVTLRLAETVSPSGTVGFQPDLVVPVSKDRGDSNPALLAARKAVQQPVGAPKTKPASPPGMKPSPENTYADMSYPTAEYRLLSLFRLWNVIHYFYPYKYLMDVSWDKTLTDFIPQFETNQNALDYATTVAHLVARFNDSHGFTRNPVLEQHLGAATAPLALKQIEGKTVVVAIPDREKNNVGGIGVGDVILAADGEDMDKRRENLGPLFAASTPQALAGRVNPYLLRGPRGSKVKARVQGRDGTVREVELTRMSLRPREPRPFLASCRPVWAIWIWRVCSRRRWTRRSQR